MGNVLHACWGGDEKSAEASGPEPRPSNKVSARKLWKGADELEVKRNPADPKRSTL